MKKHNLIVLGLLSLGMVSCQNEQIVPMEEPTEQAPQQSSSLRYGRPVPGTLIIKVTEKAFQEMELNPVGEVALRSVSSPMSVALSQLQATKVERLFPPAGKYEGRTRREGLHLFLRVTIDEKMDLTNAMEIMAKIPGVAHVEYEPQMEMKGVNNPLAHMLGDRPTVMPFNDPGLPNQWHYNNLKKVNGAEYGADINLFKAWAITTGKNNVIVDVVDGGIVVNHPDLKDNLWVNEDEIPGNGIDDDNNGYVDDINGYNFCDKKGEIVPDAGFHGTHVAGTVAARNNNGIGVCGVAGGDGTPGTGVRIMSSNVFAGKSNGGFAEAIKYGADNGAVISQNSWGNTMPGETSAAYKAAIDYFRKYAGCDNDGNQLPDSPMKGGVVIVAAGNSNSNERYAPAEYGPCIAVVAFGPDFKKASYSNYGTWCDITATGGDQDRFGTKSGVLSTVSQDAYDWFQGTSMACPHVSGVAALVVSHRGGQGFTNTQLEQILMAAVMPIDINEQNPRYADEMGVGYIDAYAAVTIQNKNKAPQTPKCLPEKASDITFDSMVIHWTVPADEDDGTPRTYEIYYSKKPLTATNYKNAESVTKAGNGTASVGSELTKKINMLDHSTTYNFAIVAVDRWGLKSAPAFMSVATKTNNPPVITNLPKDPIALLDFQKSVEYVFNVSEPDGQAWTVDAKGDMTGVTLAKLSDTEVKVTIRPILKAGDYKFTITLTDELKSSKSNEIPFRIISVTAPELSAKIPDVLIGVENDPLVVDLTKHFTPQQYLTQTFTAKAANGTVASATVDKSGKMTIKGFKPGQTSVSVTASNGYKETTTSFMVSVTQNSNNDIYAIWPLPMGKELNLWLNPAIKSAKVTLHSITGEKVLDVTATSDAQGIAKVNTKNLAPGTYRLKVSAGNKPYERIVQKK